MRTIEVTRFGGPEVLKLRERPDPVAGLGQVVVDVAAIPLLWLDTALRSGKGRNWFTVEPPYVPGNGVAGTVSAVGADVEADWIGRDVVSDTRATGSYAERVAVSADGLVPIPDELTSLTAAALLTDGRTALGILDGVAVQAGTSVLITGAAGGMGLLLIQLASACGARVVGAARGEPKLAAVRAQGAVAAVDYSEPDWTGRVLDALGDDRPSVVLDGVGGEIGRAAFAMTAEGGVFSAHGAASGDFAPLDEHAARERSITVRGISDVQFSPEESDRRLREVLAQAAAGREVVEQLVAGDQPVRAIARDPGGQVPPHRVTPAAFATWRHFCIAAWRLLIPPGSAADGIRPVSTSGPFGVGSGKSFTPFSRMHWANLRAASCSWVLRLPPVNPVGSRSLHALMACLNAGVFGSSDEPFTTPSMVNLPEAPGSGNALTPLLRMHSANFTAF